LAVTLAATFALWQHVSSLLAGSGPVAWAEHLPNVVLDAMFGVPLAVVAVWLGARAASWLGLARARTGTRAALMALFVVPVFAPLAAAAPLLHGILGTAPSSAVDGGVHASHSLPGVSAAQSGDLASVAAGGLRAVLMAVPVILVVTALALAVLDGRVRLRRGLPGRRTLAGAAASVFVVASVQVVSFALPSVASAAAAPTDACISAPKRTYDVRAINVDITTDRFGDHDPFGFMFVLNGQLAAVRAQEAALQETAATGDPDGARVSSGLGKDPIQPLVLRGRLGECVVVNLTNSLTSAARGGPGFGAIPVLTQPGGVPSVSMDVQGVAYNAAAGKGGAAVGNNPATMASPGATRQYQFYLDPLMGEGARVIHSGGDSVQLTAHGLFGTLIAEPAGSTWLDPETGADRTNDASFNSFAAIIRPGSGPNFREFAIMYHEIGDEQNALRRPAFESDSDTDCFGDPGDGLGSPLPMLDEGGIDNCGTTTDSYRPGSRALNYRSEPFFRRQELLVLTQGADDSTLPAAESLGYSSYIYGDPATPMPRSYVGEPTKTRLIMAGWEQLHVHHLHGGGDRWPQNPNAETSNFAGGLEKFPPNNQPSINLDSQTIGPGETYNLQHECGAGGCQQAVGDFLYHCHIAHHYIAGMWGIWRVFDTRQANLATVPGRTAAPTAVTTDGLIGRTIEGKTVVAQVNLTNPATQVAVESLVEGQIPPKGAKLSSTDATTLDWVKSGPATAPRYLNEIEDTTVWQNYTSATPGARPAILFNPNNGRPAYPLLRPHLGQRPPFSPNGHSGAPYLGNTVTSTRPDGLCPAAAPVRQYNITAITLPIQETAREQDPDGEIFVLNQDKNAVLAGTKPADPLVIRSNVGDCVAITFSSELNPDVQPKVNMHTHFVQFDPQGSDGVITGFNYETSIYNDSSEARTVRTATAAGATVVPVTNTTNLRVGISICRCRPHQHRDP